MYYGDGPYWDVIGGILSVTKKQQVSNESSMIHPVSHLGDLQPLRPNLILDSGVFRR